jgi:hypothetical protein
MYRAHFLSLLLSFCSFLLAQPAPGDMLKEFRRYNEAGDCHGALQVGSRLDYRVAEQLIDYRGEGLFQPPFDVDLRNAIGAELVVEKMSGKRHLSKNGIYINDFLVFTWEGPKYDYFQHDIPLEELHVLKEGIIS